MVSDHRYYFLLSIFTLSLDMATHFFFTLSLIKYQRLSLKPVINNIAFHASRVPMDL